MNMLSSCYALLIPGRYSVFYFLLLRARKLTDMKYATWVTVFLNEVRSRDFSTVFLRRRQRRGDLSRWLLPWSLSCNEFTDAFVIGERDMQPRESISRISLCGPLTPWSGHGVNSLTSFQHVAWGPLGERYTSLTPMRHRVCLRASFRFWYLSNSIKTLGKTRLGASVGAVRTKQTLLIMKPCRSGAKCAVFNLLAAALR